MVGIILRESKSCAPKTKLAFAITVLIATVPFIAYGNSVATPA